jgi:hypothetical protein
MILAAARRLALALPLVLAASDVLDAQWLTLRLPDQPRNPDGRTNLDAPAPRTPSGTPDLSGIWRAASNRYIQDLGADLGTVPFRPHAAAIYRQRLENNGLDRPSGKCLPKGVPEGMTIRGYPFKIVQTPKLTLVLYEIFVAYRQIHTDGRDFRGFAGDPSEIHPAWLGYSVGRWDGDTFLVETIGINDRTWLDDSGYPHSDALKITERMRRPAFGRLDIEFTFDDPKTYTRPWSVKIPFELVPDTELLEYVCENEKDAPHMIGK